MSKETKKDLIFRVKCQLDKNGNKYLIDIYRAEKDDKVVFANIIYQGNNNDWGKYPLTNFKVDKEYYINVSGYKIDDNRIVLFVKNELVDLLP